MLTKDKIKNSPKVVQKLIRIVVPAEEVAEIKAKRFPWPKLVDKMN